jgi:hypothetical protein
MTPCSVHSWPRQILNFPRRSERSPLDFHRSGASTRKPRVLPAQLGRSGFALLLGTSAPSQNAAGFASLRHEAIPSMLMSQQILILYAAADESSAKVKHLEERLRGEKFDTLHRGTVKVGNSISSTFNEFIQGEGPVVLIGTISTVNDPLVQSIVNQLAKRSSVPRLFTVVFENEPLVRSLAGADVRVADCSSPDVEESGLQSLLESVQAYCTISPHLTMSKWLVQSNTRMDIVARATFLAMVLAPVIANITDDFSPSPGTNWAVSIAVAALLLYQSFIGKDGPMDARLRAVCKWLATAFGWMALMYILKWLKVVGIPNGYDAVTDLIGTLFFVGAWAQLTSCEVNVDWRAADRLALALLCALAVVSGVAKFLFDINLHQAQDVVGFQAAARLALNICNGAILVGLYLSMCRMLQPPTPLVHVVVLLYGCSQISAHGTDCLPDQCVMPSFSAAVALLTAWALLAGKVAFGLYVVYLYGHGKFTPWMSGGKQ